MVPTNTFGVRVHCTQGLNVVFIGWHGGVPVVSEFASIDSRLA